MPSITRSACSIARASVSPARRSLIGVSARVRIQRADRRGRRFHFRHANGCGVVRDLALQVGEVDGVVVGEYQVTNAGRREIQRNRRAEAAKPTISTDAASKRSCPSMSTCGQHDLAAVAEQLIVVHRSPSVTRSCPASPGATRCDAKPACSNRRRTSFRLIVAVFDEQMSIGSTSRLGAPLDDDPQRVETVHSADQSAIVGSPTSALRCGSSSRCTADWRR